MSHKIAMNISFVIIMLATLSCNDITGYEVNDICKMSPRKIKIIILDLLIFINTFIISDTKNKDVKIFIVSDKNTSLGLVGEIVYLNLRLYKEISLRGEKLIIFEEYKRNETLQSL